MIAFVSLQSRQTPLYLSHYERITFLRFVCLVADTKAHYSFSLRTDLRQVNIHKHTMAPGCYGVCNLLGNNDKQVGVIGVGAFPWGIKAQSISSLASVTRNILKVFS